MEVGKAPVSSEHEEMFKSKAAAIELATSVGGRSTAAASRGLAVLDLVLRFVAVIATVGSAIAMGTTNQTLPFFTQFLRFKAQYDDLPTLTYVRRPADPFCQPANSMIVFIPCSTNATDDLCCYVNHQVLRGGEFDRCRLLGPLDPSVHPAHHQKQGEV
jgi:hypothetical protein